MICTIRLYYQGHCKEENYHVYVVVILICKVLPFCSRHVCSTAVQSGSCHDGACLDMPFTAESRVELCCFRVGNFSYEYTV